MAFFAKKPAPEIEFEAAIVPPQEEGPAKSGVSPMVAKILGMIGLSMDDVTAAGDRIAKKANEYSDALQRLETKVDLLSQDMADLQDELRAERTKEAPPARAYTRGRNV